MKLVRVLLFLIFNSILWSLINSVKNNKNQNELTRVEETSEDLNKICEGAESSFAPQIQKYGKTLKPTPKITKNEINKNTEEKRLKKKEYNRNHYQKKKDTRKEYTRNYREQNKERKLEYDRKYREKNKARISERKKSAKYKQNIHQYYVNNREKKREYDQMRRQKKNNQKEIHKNGILKLKKVDNTLETSNNSTNNNCENKGKDPIVCEEYRQLSNSKGNSFVNSQTDDCVNNLSDTNACSYVQKNVQEADDARIQKVDDHDDLIDQSLFDDQNFLDYLDSVLHS
uniref:Uncharacterized protein n=1 Tax=Meloidogyne enterolobii TaxID=390850 RepID=A0A6V7UGV3_MELEN|nr:unnamed protein product [Meloidogyne enterolobii]